MEIQQRDMSDEIERQINLRKSFETNLEQRVNLWAFPLCIHRDLNRHQYASVDLQLLRLLQLPLLILVVLCLTNSDLVEHLLQQTRCENLANRVLVRIRSS